MTSSLITPSHPHPHTKQNLVISTEKLDSQLIQNTPKTMGKNSFNHLDDIHLNAVTFLEYHEPDTWYLKSIELTYFNAKPESWKLQSADQSNLYLE